MKSKRIFKVVGAILVLVAAAGALAGSFLLAQPYDAPVVDGAVEAAPPIALAPRAAGARPLAVTRIAHASVLLDFDGLRVLTDPWFTEKMHYHHGEPLGMALAQLPHLDAIVISHAHYDHFDIQALAAYPDKSVPLIVGPDMLEAAHAAGFTRVVELKPWETWSGGDLKVTAVPAQHKVPEITFVLQARGRTVYFGGDTMFIPELRELPRRFPQIDLALLAVNGLHVMGKQVVMNADEAAQLAGLLHARVAVPTHYRFVGSWFTDTFVLSRDGTAERFAEAAQVLAPGTQVRILAPGQRQAIVDASP